MSACAIVCAFAQCDLIIISSVGPVDAGLAILLPAACTIMLQACSNFLNTSLLSKLLMRMHMPHGRWLIGQRKGTSSCHVTTFSPSGCWTVQISESWQMQGYMPLASPHPPTCPPLLPQGKMTMCLTTLARSCSCRYGLFFVMRHRSNF